MSDRLSADGRTSWRNMSLRGTSSTDDRNAAMCQLHRQTTTTPRQITTTRQRQTTTKPGQTTAAPRTTTAIQRQTTTTPRQTTTTSRQTTTTAATTTAQTPLRYMPSSSPASQRTSLASKPWQPVGQTRTGERGRSQLPKMSSQSQREYLSPG